MPQKPPIDLAAFLAANRQMLGRVMLVTMMMPFMFMTGGLAMGAYVMSSADAAFFRDAQPAKAILVARRAETTRNSVNNTITTRVMFDVRFQTAAGQPVATRMAEGGQSFLRPGDRIAVMYDPANPRNIKSATDKQNAFIGMTVARLSGAAFVLLMAMAVLAVRGPRAVNRN